MRDYSNVRGFVPFQDPSLPGRTYFQTMQGWRGIRAQLTFLAFQGCQR